MRDYSRCRLSLHELSGDEVELTAAASLIAKRNPPSTVDDIIGPLMQSFWAERLMLFAFIPPAGGERDQDGNFRRSPARNVANGDPVYCFDGAKEEAVGRVVNDCVRVDWSRESFFDMLPSRAIDRGIQPDAAGFRALGRMEPRRLYGEFLERLATMWASAPVLAQWCEENSLVPAPGWRRNPSPHVTDPANNLAGDSADFIADQVNAISRYAGYVSDDEPVVAYIIEMMQTGQFKSLRAAVQSLDETKIAGAGNEKSKRHRIYDEARKRLRPR